MAKQRIVAFCGAGFSVCIGIPAMDVFSDRLRDSGFLDLVQQREFDLIQAECNNLSALIGESARNLEQLASFLDVLDLIAPKHRFKGCRIYTTPKKARDLIVQAIRFIANPSALSTRTARSSTLIRLHRSFKLSLITTNYDLHLELNGITKVTPTESVLEACTQGSTGGLYSHAPDAEDSVDLFKLHGSVNWFTIAKKFVVEDRPQEVDDGKGGVLDGVYRVRLDDSPPQLGPSSSCMIVPPSVIKPQRDKVLQEQWQGAAAALASADRIWFIGYSFPESDSFMRYFLASALSGNSKLRQIVVIDPSRDVTDRCRHSVFASPQHSTIAHFLSCPWEAVNLDMLATGDVERAVDQQVLRSMRDNLEREQILAGEVPATRIITKRVGRGRGR